MKKILFILILTVALLSGCQGTTVYQNLKYVDTITTTQATLLEFIDSDGNKVNFYINSGDQFFLNEKDTYNVEVTNETWYAYGGYIRRVTKVN